MRFEKKKKNKFLQKKLLRLKTNPLNSNKFLKPHFKLVKKIIYSPRGYGKFVQKVITLQHFSEIAKARTEKWKNFLELLVKSVKFFKKYRPYTFHHHSVSNFASSGNSFKKQFKKDLFTKKIFNYFYGNLHRKPLKKTMDQIYNSKQIKNSYRNLCTEYFESRLDAVLKRTYFCLSIKEAKQTIMHKHVLINNKVETNHSYILKQGDLIQINSQSRQFIKARLQIHLNKLFDNNCIIWPMLPSYLNINFRTLEIIFGDIKNFKFSNSFTFKNENERVVESYYRH
jgi:ribosomal protein S4